MSEILTPEVMAAMERLRDAKDGNPPWEYADEDGIEARSSDAEVIADAMLSLFPPGMPAPVEMWTADMDGTSIVATGHRLVEKQVVRGLFIPLEVLETP